MEINELGQVLTPYDCYIIKEFNYDISDDIRKIKSSYYQTQNVDIPLDSEQIKFVINNSQIKKRNAYLEEEVKFLRRNAMYYNREADLQELYNPFKKSDFHMLHEDTRVQILHNTRPFQLEIGLAGKFHKSSIAYFRKYPKIDLKESYYHWGNGYGIGEFSGKDYMEIMKRFHLKPKDCYKEV